MHGRPEKEIGIESLSIYRRRGGGLYAPRRQPCGLFCLPVQTRYVSLHVSSPSHTWLGALFSVCSALACGFLPLTKAQIGVYIMHLESTAHDSSFPGISLQFDRNRCILQYTPEWISQVDFMADPQPAHVVDSWTLGHSLPTPPTPIRAFRLSRLLSQMHYILHESPKLCFQVAPVNVIGNVGWLVLYRGDIVLER